VEALGLDGRERFDVEGVSAALDGEAERRVRVVARRPDGSAVRFEAVVRIDTPQESRYYRHGGILPYVLRQLLLGRERPAAVAAGLAIVPGAETSAAALDGLVDASSEASFPASDPPTY
jgi:aconitate hydratase